MTDAPEQKPQKAAQRSDPPTDKPAPRKLTRKEVEQATEDAILGDRIRAQDAVLQRVAEKLNLPARKLRPIRSVILNKYESIVQKHLTGLILQMLREGREEHKVLIQRVREERFDYPDNKLLELIRECKQIARKQASQRVQTKIQAGREQLNSADVAEKRQAALGAYRTKLAGLVSESIQKNKEKFLGGVRKTFKLEYMREAEMDDQVVIVHRGVYRGKEIFLKSVFTHEDVITNVSILIRRVVDGKKQTINLDVLALAEKWGREEDGTAICMRNLHSVNKILDLREFVSVIWFLETVLVNGEDIPPETTAFLDDQFFPFLNRVESDLLQEMTQKMVEQKYYALSEERLQ